METFYLSSMPTFSELAQYCSNVDQDHDNDHKSVDIISLETGEVYAHRDETKMWQIWNYATDRYKSLEKKYLRGYISYADFLRLIEEM